METVRKRQRGSRGRKLQFLGYEQITALVERVGANLWATLAGDKPRAKAGCLNSAMFLVVAVQQLAKFKS